MPDRTDTGPLPVVYLLHGYGASHREWLTLGGVEAMLDRLIAAGIVAPLIAIMPDGGKSWYVDSAARGGPGDFATAITRDLVDHVDATLPTAAEPGRRAVMGLSMGGYGALVLGFSDAAPFGQVVALSPAVFVPGGLSFERWSLGRTEAERQGWFQGAFGRPFDPAIYGFEEPSAQIGRMVDAGAAPRILLASGDDDFFGFELGTVELFLALRRAGLAADLRIDQGAHDWAYWQPAAAAAFRWLDAGWHAAPESLSRSD